MNKLYCAVKEMKAKRQIFAFFVFAALVCILKASPVSANDGYYASFSYSKSSHMISVSGKCSEQKNYPFVITVIASDMSISDVSDVNLPVITEMAHTTDGGIIDLDIYLPAALQTDTYSIYLSSSNFCSDDKFIYSAKKDVESCLSMVNGVGSVAEMKSVLGENQKELGIDSVLYSDDANANVIASYIYYMKPKDGFLNADSLTVRLDQGHAWAMIKSGADVAAVLKKYGEAIGISYENEFTKYPADVQTSFFSLIKSADYVSKPLDEIFCEVRALSFIKSSKSWNGLKQAVLGGSDGEELYINILPLIDESNGKYDKLSDKNYVFMEMYRVLERINSFADAKKAFLSAVDIAYSSEKQSHGGSGGSGSSSKGSKGNIISPVGAGSSLDNDKYGDMDQHWARNYVYSLSSLGIINGFPDGSFRPEQAITRAEFVKIVCEAFKIGAGRKRSFSDVSDNDWFADYVYRVSAHNIVLGNDLNCFLPNENITREDACVILYRCMGSVADNKEDALYFKDMDDISEYAVNPVKFLYGNKIVKGTSPENFEPKSTATRAQSAALICRVLDYISAH